MSCPHYGAFDVTHVLPVQLDTTQSVIISVVICRACGDVRYRSPSLPPEDISQPPELEREPDAAETTV